MTLPFKRNLKDAELVKAFALNNGAGSTTSAYIDILTGEAALGHAPEMMELGVSVPALATGIIGNAETVDLIIEVANQTDFSDAMEVANVQVAGAGGAGIAATEARGRIPSGFRYARGKVTLGASTGDASGSNGEFAVLY